MESGPQPTLSQEEEGKASQNIDNWPWRVIDSAEALAEFSTWLTDLGNQLEKTPVGIHTAVAFATKEQGWLVPSRDSQMYPLLQVVLKTLLSNNAAPVFISRDTPGDVEELAVLADLPRETIAPLFVHDMNMIAHTTGRQVLPRGDMTPLQDALDSAFVGPMLLTEVPPFYTQVAMPLIRELSVGPAVETEENVSIKYTHLLLRVLAHYTADPLISSWFEDGMDVQLALNETLDTSSEGSLAFLLWMCCGQDTSIFTAFYPGLVNSLPDNPEVMVVDIVDKHLPVLRLGLMELAEQCSQRLTIETMYGRIAPRGQTSAWYLHFMITGAVSDIIDVVCASLPNVGLKDVEVVTDVRYTMNMQVEIVGCSEDVSLEAKQRIEDLTSLDNPLGTHELEPEVTLT